MRACPVLELVCHTTAVPLEVVKKEHLRPELTVWAAKKEARVQVERLVQRFEQALKTWIMLSVASQSAGASGRDFSISRNRRPCDVEAP